MREFKINNVAKDQSGHWDIMLWQNQIKNSPSVQALIHFEACFYKMGLPMDGIGKIKINVSESFWEDKKWAFKTIEAYCGNIKELYDIVCEHFGNKADKIFSDMLSDMEFTIV